MVVMLSCHSSIRLINFSCVHTDEEALVNAASKAGVVFEERLPNHLVISVVGLHK